MDREHSPDCTNGGEYRPLGQLFDLIGLSRLSGKVEVSGRTELFALFVDRGTIVAASSNLRTLRLGHLLLQRGAVEPLYLHDVLLGRRAVPRMRALGGTLLDEGAVTRAELLATIDEQIAEILARIMALHQPLIRVIADEPLPDGLERGEVNFGDLTAEADRRYARRLANRALMRLLPLPDQGIRLQAQLGVISGTLSDTELLVALEIDQGATTLNRLGSAVPVDPLKL